MSSSLCRYLLVYVGLGRFCRYPVLLVLFRSGVEVYIFKHGVTGHIVVSVVAQIGGWG